MEFVNIILTKEVPVATIELNRPEVLNALNHKLLREIASCLEQLDGDQEVKCIIITGNEKAFAAGADIKEMAEAGTIDMLFSGEDQKEGMRAFIEKRFPRWTGR